MHLSRTPPWPPTVTAQPADSSYPPPAQTLSAFSAYRCDSSAGGDAAQRTTAAQQRLMCCGTAALVPQRRVNAPGRLCAADTADQPAGATGCRPAQPPIGRRRPPRARPSRIDRDRISSQHDTSCERSEQGPTGSPAPRSHPARELLSLSLPALALCR